jgi:hypothetical protein
MDGTRNYTALTSNRLQFALQGGSSKSCSSANEDVIGLIKIGDMSRYPRESSK